MKLRWWQWGAICSLVVTMVMLCGCGSAKNAVRRDRTLSANSVLALVQERNGKVKTLKGGGSITIESPEGSNNGSFDAMVKKPDSLRVELNGPFGIHVGSLLLARDTFVYYNRFDNTAVVGKPDGKTLQSMFRLKMQFDEVIDAFTGEFPAVSVGDSLERFSVNDDGFYVLTFATADGSKEYKIDGDAFIVSSYRVFGPDGHVVVSASAGEVDEDEGIPVPRILRIIFPAERRSVTIAYDDIVVNEPVACSFTIPKHAEIMQR